MGVTVGCLANKHRARPVLGFLCLCLGWRDGSVPSPSLNIAKTCSCHILWESGVVCSLVPLVESSLGDEVKNFYLGRSQLTFDERTIS